MYKRILVAVDGSETANAALQEAIELAKDHDTQIRLLHVVDLTMAYSVAEAPHIFEYRKAMEDAGKIVLAGCSTWPRSAGVPFDTKCVVMFAKHVYEVIEALDRKRAKPDTGGRNAPTITLPTLSICSLDSGKGQ
jgi:nucleotide-binding universal stress UspA family protein